MIREKTHPCASVQLPPLRSVGLRRVSCFLIKAARTVSVKICDLWEKYSRAACPHHTSHIPHPTFHIPHSQHSSPKSTLFFPPRPAPRPNTPFSAHHCNRLSFSHLSSERRRSTFPTRPSTPRNAIFRPSIPALSKPHPLPFASRSLSYRNSKHAQRRVLRSASSVQTDLFRPIRPATPAISPKNPTQVFHQKSLEC